MPRPKLYKNGRKKMMLEASLAEYLFKVTEATGIPATQLLDEAVLDWKAQKGANYLYGGNSE